MKRKKLTPEQRELKRLCAQLAKTIGAGHKPSADWIERQHRIVMAHERELAADAAARDIVTVEQRPYVPAA